MIKLPLTWPQPHHRLTTLPLGSGKTHPFSILFLICEMGMESSHTFSLPNGDTQTQPFTKYLFFLLTPSLKPLYTKEFIVLPMCIYEGELSSDFVS